MLCFGIFTHDNQKNRIFSIFLGFILPVFNEAILPCLLYRHRFLIVLKYIIHSFLLQRTGAVFEASAQRTDGCNNYLDMSVYPVQVI